MGEKGMDTGGIGAGGMGGQVAGVPLGQNSEMQKMDQVATGVQPPPQPPPQSSGPDAGEIIGDILDPLGLHKLLG